MILDKNIRILIVDANPSMRRITGNMLREIRLPCFQEAVDGDNALKRIISEPFDLIVAEWTLPGLSGIELLRRLRSEAPFERLPFLFLSSEGSQENILHAAQTGASGFLVRPLSAAKMGEKIADVMRNATRAKGTPPQAAKARPAPARPEIRPEARSEPASIWEEDDAEDGRLYSIIKRRAILTYFHPIVSVRGRAVVGFEAYSRGRLDGEIVYPEELFELARQEDLLGPLDILCRERAIANFRPLYEANRNIFLALNVLAGAVSRGETELDDLAPACREAGLRPGSVALEIDESSIEETDYLYRFVTGLREQGFLTIFDNVGRHHLHFDTIAALKPDLIKLDRTLVRDVDKDFAKQQTLRALVNIAGKAGAAVAAMGVEREEEALVCLENGVDLMQGYYFSRPSEERNVIRQCFAQAEALSKAYERHAKNKIIAARDLYAEANRRLEELARSLAASGEERFDELLQAFLAERREMDSVYALDETGRQVTHGLRNHQGAPDTEPGIAKPHHRGENHALKDYYLYIMAGYERFATESFASPVSGRLCKTLCRQFRDASGARYILCADLIVESV